MDELSASESFTIGLLLPFTGSSAATAQNFERAVLYAAERVNDAGGLHGKSLRIVAMDTHSDPKRGVQSAEELIAAGAVAVIGPESPEVAEAVLPIFNESEVVLVSPLVGEGEEQNIDCDYPWFRLAPSAQALGDSLATALAQEGIDRIAILYGSGDYNRAFRTAVRVKFEGSVLQGSVVIERSLDETQSSFAQEIEEVLAENPDAIVVSTSPQMGATVVTEASLLGTDNALWALSPLLKTPLFLHNVDTDSLKGSIGVAPKIFDNSEDFPNAFDQRWLGDDPLEGAYFYYDAVGLLSLALASVDDPDSITHEDLKQAIVETAGTRGVATGWDDIESGLSRISRGLAVNYSGLTGPLLLQECGNRRTGVSQKWTVQGGEIVDLP